MGHDKNFLLFVLVLVVFSLVFALLEVHFIISMSLGIRSHVARLVPRAELINVNGAVWAHIIFIRLFGRMYDSLLIFF